MIPNSLELKALKKHEGKKEVAKEDVGEEDAQEDLTEQEGELSDDEEQEYEWNDMYSIQVQSMDTVISQASDTRNENCLMDKRNEHAPFYN